MSVSGVMKIVVRNSKLRPVVQPKKDLKDELREAGINTLALSMGPIILALIYVQFIAMIYHVDPGQGQYAYRAVREKEATVRMETFNMAARKAAEKSANADRARIKSGTGSKGSKARARAQVKAKTKALEARARAHEMERKAQAKAQAKAAQKAQATGTRSWYSTHRRRQQR